MLIGRLAWGGFGPARTDNPSVTQDTPLKSSSIPSNKPMTHTPESGH